MILNFCGWADIETPSRYFLKSMSGYSHWPGFHINARFWRNRLQLLYVKANHIAPTVISRFHFLDNISFSPRTSSITLVHRKAITSAEQLLFFIFYNKVFFLLYRPFNFLSFVKNRYFLGTKQSQLLLNNSWMLSSFCGHWNANSLTLAFPLSLVPLFSPFSLVL